MRGTVDWHRNIGAFIAFLGPPLSWFMLFFAVPLAIVWAYSFGTNVGVSGIEITGTFANYGRTLEPVYLAILWKSILVAGAATLICLLIGFPVALAISFAPPSWKSWLLIGVMLPFWTNLLVRTYALISILRTEGLVNQAIAAIAPSSAPLPLLYSNGAVILGLVYVHLPFTVLPIYASLDRLDRTLIEASLDLGAGHLRTIANIVLPLAAPGLAAAVLLTFIPALGSYLIPDLMGGPDSQMIANVIERQFKRASDWPFGAALAFMLMYLTLLALAARGLLRTRDGAE
jgi:spermidine/putrescine transport system permease protein